jgi:hypothetical protein
MTVVTAEMQRKPRKKAKISALSAVNLYGAAPLCGREGDLCQSWQWSPLL